MSKGLEPFLIILRLEATDLDLGGAFERVGGNMLEGCSSFSSRSSFFFCKCLIPTKRFSSKIELGASFRFT
jgi:hypothetical protein